MLEKLIKKNGYNPNYGAFVLESIQKFDESLFIHPPYRLKNHSEKNHKINEIYHILQKKDLLETLTYIEKKFLPDFQRILDITLKPVITKNYKAANATELFINWLNNIYLICSKSICLDQQNSPVIEIIDFNTANNAKVVKFILECLEAKKDNKPFNKEKINFLSEKKIPVEQINIFNCILHRLYNAPINLNGSEWETASTVIKKIGIHSTINSFICNFDFLDQEEKLLHLLFDFDLKINLQFTEGFLKNIDQLLWKLHLCTKDQEKIIINIAVDLYFIIIEQSPFQVAKDLLAYIMANTLLIFFEYDGVFLLPNKDEDLLQYKERLSISINAIRTKVEIQVLASQLEELVIKEKSAMVWLKDNQEIVQKHAIQLMRVDSIEASTKKLLREMTVIENKTDPLPPTKKTAPKIKVETKPAVRNFLWKIKKGYYPPEHPADKKKLQHLPAELYVNYNYVSLNENCDIEAIKFLFTTLQARDFKRALWQAENDLLTLFNNKIWDANKVIDVLIAINKTASITVNIDNGMLKADDLVNREILSQICLSFLQEVKKTPLKTPEVVQQLANSIEKIILQQVPFKYKNDMMGLILHNIILLAYQKQLIQQPTEETRNRMAQTEEIFTLIDELLKKNSASCKNKNYDLKLALNADFLTLCRKFKEKFQVKNEVKLEYPIEAKKTHDLFTVKSIRPYKLLHEITGIPWAVSKTHSPHLLIARVKNYDDAKKIQQQFAATIPMEIKISPNKTDDTILCIFDLNMDALKKLHKEFIDANKISSIKKAI